MDMDKIRQNLESEEMRLQRLSTGIREEGDLDLTEQDSNGAELSSADQHPAAADAATETQGRELNFSMLEQLEAELGHRRAEELHVVAQPDAQFIAVVQHLQHGQRRRCDRRRQGVRE